MKPDNALTPERYEAMRADKAAAAPTPACSKE